jgi:hypothetical protein
MKLYFLLHGGRAMTKAVSRRSVTAEARVRSQVSPCGICGGRNVTGTDLFPPQYFGLPLSASFHECSVLHSAIIDAT